MFYDSLGPIAIISQAISPITGPYWRLYASVRAGIDILLSIKNNPFSVDGAIKKEPQLPSQNDNIAHFLKHALQWIHINIILLLHDILDSLLPSLKFTYSSIWHD